MVLRDWVAFHVRVWLSLVSASRRREMSGHGPFQTAKNLFVTTLLAIIFIFVGVLVASNLNLSPRPHAQSNQEALTTPAIEESGFTISPSPFVTVAEKVKPTVVNISAERITERSSLPRFPFRFFEDPFEEFFRDRGREEPREPRKMKEQSLGSGVIIDRQGHILTNNHVIRGAEEIKVRLSDDREFQAKAIGQDQETDVALIKLEIGGLLPPEEVAILGDSDDIQVGDWAIAVGNPFGLDRTVTVGVISAKGRSNLDIVGGTPAYQNFIQTDASINFGNSGGPLVNINGEVIGINTAINVQGQGIGFAIPINMAKKVSDELKAQGKVVRGYLGMLPQEITPDIAEAKDLSSTEGVLVGQVSEDTPAQRGGLEVGDVIINFDGQKVEGVRQFRLMVAEKSPGSKVNIVVMRDGQRKELIVTLGDRAEYLSLASEGEGEGEKPSWLGIEVEDVHGDFARRSGLDEERGVVVTSVEVGSPADDKGITRGDVILRIGNEEVEDIEDYRRILRALEGQTKAILFLIKRGDQTSFVAVKPE
jgi:serine protease Do